MNVPPQLAAVLDTVIQAQALINEQTDLIGQLLDEALMHDGKFDHLSIEELSNCISALPDGCFYRVELMRAWRRRREAQPLPFGVPPKAP